MAKKTVIKASDVKVGDLIRNVFSVEDTVVTRQGIVDLITETLLGEQHFRTAKGYSLGPVKDSTIYLLDRPKPEPLVPSRTGAVVKYTVDFDEHLPVRTALRDKLGRWVCYNDKGAQNDDYPTDAEFIRFLTESEFTPEVVFAGVTK